jgi:hypothetical protein
MDIHVERHAHSLPAARNRRSKGPSPDWLANASAR